MEDIVFHCSEEGNFPGGQLVRGFIYRDYSIEVHNHDFYEVNIIFAGTGIHRIENGSFRVSTGDVFVIPPNVAHSYVETDQLDVYHILLKKEFVAEEYQQASRVKGFLQFMEIEPFIRGNSGMGGFLHLHTRELAEIKEELALLEDCEYEAPEYEILKKHVVWKVLLRMSYLLNRQFQEEEKPSERYRAEMIKVLEYLHEHYAEKITVEQLCNRVFLSRSTFLRNFQMMCGCSPMEYLERYRCQKATVALEEKKMSRTAIAHSCGFYDLSHMNRILKKWNGPDRR